MNRAGSPGGGRKKTAAEGTAKTPVGKPKPEADKPAAKAAKPAKAVGDAGKGVSAALGKAKSRAGDLVGKAAKSIATQGREAAKRLSNTVTSITNSKTAGQAAKSAKSVKSAAESMARSVAESVAKAAKPSAKAKAAAKETAKGAGSRKTASKAKTDKASEATAPPAKPASRAPKPRATSRTLRPKAFGELETARGFGFPEATPELPENYGEDRLVLMTKDPEYLFTYWEITPERLALGERAKHPGDEYREALRLNWTSRDLLEDSFALLPVSLDAKRWYLRVPFSGLSYHVEIGWLSDQGHFISLLGSSNASDAPESWAVTRQRLKGLEEAVMTYSLRNAQPLGSSESARPAGASPRRPLPSEYQGPGSQSSSDAARKAPAPEGAGGSRS